MATDMLEMILNRQPARLTERIAKFVIYQVIKTFKFFFITLNLYNFSFKIYFFRFWSHYKNCMSRKLLIVILLKF